MSSHDRARLTPKQWLLVSTLLGIGTSLRFFKLGAWSISDDEVYTLINALWGAESPPIVIISPVSFLLTRWFVDGFSGWLPFEALVRLPHALLSSVTVLLAFGLIRRVSGVKVALLMMAMFAFSPWCLYHAQFARYNAALVLFSLIAGASYARWLKEDHGGLRRRAGVMAIFGGVGAILCHPTGVMIPLVIGVDLIAFRLRGKDPQKLKKLLKASGVLGLLGAITLALLWESFEKTVLFSLRIDKAGIDTPADIVQGLVYNIGIQVVFVEALAVWMVFRAHRVIAQFLLIWIAVPTVVILVFSLLQVSVAQRYLLATLPAHFWLASLAVLEIGSRIEAHYRSQARLGGGAQKPTSSRELAWIASLLILIWLPSVQSHYADGNRFDFRSAAQFVEERCEPGSVVVAEQHSLVAHYARWPDRRVLEAPPGPIIEIDEVILKLDTVKKRIAEARDLWIIIPEHHTRDVGWRGRFARWSIQNCRLVKVFYQPRLDYHQNILWVLHRRMNS